MTNLERGPFEEDGRLSIIPGGSASQGSWKKKGPRPVPYVQEGALLFEPDPESRICLYKKRTPPSSPLVNRDSIGGAPPLGG